MRNAGWGGRDGTGRSPSPKKEGGLERKTNLTLPSYVWVGGGKAKWPNAARGETVAAFLYLFGMSDPPKRKNYFPLRVCFLREGEYTGTEVWQKLHRGGGASTRLGGLTPPFCVGGHCRMGSAVYTQGGKAGKGDEAGA